MPKCELEDGLQEFASLSRGVTVHPKFLETKGSLLSNHSSNCYGTSWTVKYW